MFSIIANPTEVTPNNLGLINTDNIVITKIIDRGGRTSVTTDQNGGYGFGTVKETVGATGINEHFLVTTRPEDLLLYDFPAGPLYLTTYNNRTPQCRIAFVPPARTGKIIHGYFFHKVSGTIVGGGTGTLTIALVKIATDGTVTSIATTDYSITANYNQITIAGSGAGVAIDEGDRLAMEFTITPGAGTTTAIYCTFNLAITSNNAILTIY